MLRKPALPLLFFLVAVPACGDLDADDDADDPFASTEAALTTFTAAQCNSPTVTTQLPALGVARTSLNGCLLSRAPNESGAAMMTRASTLLGDTPRFGTLKRDDGERVFSRFTPLAPTGSLTSSTGLVQDIDVRLNMPFSPSARLRVTRKRNTDGSYGIVITNVTPFRATIAFIPVTVVKVNNFALDVRLRPEANGLGVRGTSQITLEHEKQEAANASALVRQLLDWLKGELD